MHGEVTACLRCNGSIKPWSPKPPKRSDFDRKRFLERKSICFSCKQWGEHHHNGRSVVGCGSLPRPCDAEKRWTWDSPHWCPLGKVAYADAYTYRKNRNKTIVPPVSWSHSLSPSRDIAFVTFAIGKNATELAEFTLPRMQRYAERCGADFLCFTDDQFSDFPIGNKFRLSEIGRHYRKVVYMDVDIWIEDTLPNLFQLRDGKVWWFAEQPYWNAGQNWWHPQDTAMLADTQDVVAPTGMDMRNTGVVVFDKEHAGMWRQPSNPFRWSHTAEQTWVEMQAVRLRLPFGKLPLKYNLQVWVRQHWGKRLAHIYHLAGSPHSYRIKWLEQRRSGVSPLEIDIPIDF